VSATGYADQFLPPGPERDECMGLMRLGFEMAKQHTGRKRGFLYNYLLELARGMGGALTFERLVLELRLQARRRELLGEGTSPIEKVDEEFELLTWHDPRRGRRQTPFGTLRNRWTDVRKFFLADDSRVGLNRENRLRK
jgi:hypothetical protein